MKRFKRYLSAEIKIEFKACLYFFAILFFYAVYQLVRGRFYTGIAQMAEMILATYAMGYVQVFLLGNFEEAEHVGKRELGSAFLCMTVYTALSWLLGWYDRNAAATALFFLWLSACYGSIMLVYRIKRDIDTENLNMELEAFKNRKRKQRPDK